MEKTGVKAVLSSSTISNTWEESSCDDLLGLVNSIKNVRQSINDYLTDVINKEKGFHNKFPSKPPENSDEEEEDVEDAISGFIKEAVVSEGTKMNNKRKVQTGSMLHDAKKKK